MKEVVVIGAGPAGLAALRSLAKCEDKVKITAYDSNGGVGGQWINRYSHQHRAAYDQFK